MSEIKNVAVLGAGAMGAYFASRFFAAEGFSTALLARGERLERLRRQGLVVNNEQFPVQVLDPVAEGGAMDLVIVALKHQHLAEALSHLGNLVDEQTLFLSVMNGLESEPMIGEAYGHEKVLFAVSVAIDALRDGNNSSYTNPGVHYFGEANNTVVSDKVKRVQQAFDRAGIQHKTPVDMTRMMWWKFMLNVGINQASAVIRAPYAVFQQSRRACDLMETLMREVITLAKANNIDLTEQDIRDWYPIMETLSPQGKTSMLQDIESGRKTEVEIFAGSVVRMGQEAGIPTPVNQAMLQIIQVLESAPQLH